MKYVYTLTSTSRDYYYEQFLLSATSLKQYNPDSNIILLCDSKTRETLAGNRSGYEKLVSDVIAVDAPSDLLQIEVSRWVRTSIRRFVQGDFLFLDGDTIVTDDLSSVFKMGITFGACLDKHSLVSDHSKKDSIIDKNKKLGFDSHFSNMHFNGGVLFCTDTPQVHKFFARWHELWLFSKSKQILRDQPSLNMAIHENMQFFTELNGTWNCQIAYNGLPYLVNSKIIHYFATDKVFGESPFILASDYIFQKIKDSGTLPEEVFGFLENPRAAFFPNSRIIAGAEMVNLLDSDFIKFIFLLRKKLPRLFAVFNKLCYLGKSIVKTFLVKKSQKEDGGISTYN